MGKGVGVCSVHWESSHHRSEQGRAGLVPFVAVPIRCLRPGNVLLCCSIWSEAGDQGTNARAGSLLISMYANSPNELQHCAQSTVGTHSWVWGAGRGLRWYLLGAAVASPAEL